MTENDTLTLRLRRQELARDEAGRNVWRVIEEAKEVAPRETLIVVCDMWDRHWSRGAQGRVAAMAPRMNAVLGAARETGVLIAHAPSDAIDFYRDSPARRRVLDVPTAEPPQESVHDDPPLPFETPEKGSDTNRGDENPSRVYTRQIETIEIDQDRDCISDDGLEIYSLIRARSIRHLVIMGVHTNMCILNRSFGIKAMKRWGVDVVLSRDLTDAMYDPAKPPYVSHDEGTRLVVEYIEKFWCPTVLSGEVFRV